jgi:FdhD protein
MNTQPPSLSELRNDGGDAVDGGLPTIAPVRVLRLDRDTLSAAEDQVIEEVPVALVYNGISHAVLLATPEHLADLALGFSLSEGILGRRQELYDVDIKSGCQGIEVHLEIASSRFAALKERRRTLAGRTGCGLCGVESLEAVARPAAVVNRGQAIAPAAVARALAALPEYQTLHRITGAVHGAAWVDATGRILQLREDVGRHNALDKLLGWMARQSLDPTTGFLLVSSRASYEMVQKAASQGIGCLVAISAPTALAVRLAEEHNVTLAGFARGQRLVVYSHGEYLLDGAVQTATGREH